MNFYEALTDPQLFGPHFAAPSFAGWRTIGKVLSGYPEDAFTLEEQAMLFEITRRKPFGLTLRELWLIIGRRGGKSRFSGFLALYLATCKDWRGVLSKGERGVGMIICPDRRQGRVVRGYILGFIESSPLLKSMVQSVTKEAIHFSNGISIEIHTASYRTVRGYTVVFAVLDEIAFFRNDESANPDSEIVAGLKPAGATVRDFMLIGISSPYARRGVLWQAHQKHFGKESESVLVIQAPSQVMNPNIPPQLIQEALEEDEAAAGAEYFAQFRKDVEGYASKEVIAACTITGRVSLPPASSVRYFGFTDPSGGSKDSFTLGIAHNSNGRTVVDLVLERRPPFSPEAVVAEFCETLKTYHVHTVVGDRFGGEWCREPFRKHGINYDLCERTKSELYLAFLPQLTSGQVELPDSPRLSNQLLGLERRTSRTGRDIVDHGPSPNAHDDVANSVAGCAWLAAGQGLKVRRVWGSDSKPARFFRPQL